VDGAIDAAAAQKSAVSSVDDGVDIERGDIGDQNVEARGADLGGELGHGATISPPLGIDLGFEVDAAFDAN
jgi:hypothetical protein